MKTIKTKKTIFFIFHPWIYADNSTALPYLFFSHAYEVPKMTSFIMSSRSRFVDLFSAANVLNRWVDGK